MGLSSVSIIYYTVWVVLLVSCVYFKTLIITSGDNIRDKNISILHLSCRTSDLQFSLVLKYMHLSFKSVCNKEHKGVICNMTF